MKNKSLKFNAILNVIKQLCSVIFPLITIPYVSRILQSENYGKYNFGNSIISYFSLIAALGVSTYAVREGAKYRDDLKKITKFSREIFTINIISMIISYLLLFILLAVPSPLTSYRKLILIQSIVIFLTTIGADWINTIYEDFAYITLRYIFMQIISIFAMFIFVKKPSDYIVYAIITVCSNAGANILNFFHIRKYVKLKLTRKLNLKTHLKPLILLFSNAVAVTIYVNSDTTLLGLLDGDVSTGLYSIAAKIYMIIKQLLNAVIIVSLPKLSLYIGIGKKREYLQLLRKIVNSLMSILCPAMVGIFMLSKNIIVIISGKQYVKATSALQILSIALLFAIFACFFTNCILIPCKQDGLFLKATISGAIVNVILNFLCIPILSFNGTAMTTVIAEFIVCIISYSYVKKQFKIGIDTETIYSVVIGCIFIILICKAILLMVENIFVSTILCCGLSVCVYIASLILLKNKIMYEILDEVKKRLGKKDE